MIHRVHKFILHHKGGKLKFTLPCGWHEVTYKDYLLYLEHKENPLKVFEIFTGIDIEIWEEPHNPALFQSMNEQLNFLSTEPLCKRPDAIHRKGEMYNIPKDLLRMVFDKYTDLITLYRISAKDELTIMQAVPRMVGIFACVDYDSPEELEEIGEDILEMRADQVYTLAGFFLKKLEGSKPGKRRTYQVRKMIRLILRPVLIYLPLSLVFLWSFIRSPMETLRGLNTLINYAWRRFMYGDRLIMDLDSAKRSTQKQKVRDHD